MENLEERIKFYMDDENIPNGVFALLGELVGTVAKLQEENKKLKEELLKNQK